jgi:RND family efflux transporter MFP subunit
MIMKSTSAITLLLMVACMGCEQAETKGGSSKASGIPVMTTTPVIKDITTYMETIGTLEAAQAFEVRPQVNGTIASILVSEGAWVKRGDVLFTIDARPYEIMVKQAEAQIAIDTANAIAARQKVERLRGLADKDLIPQLEWEGAQASAKASEALISLDNARLAAAQLDLDNCTICAIGDGRMGKINVYPGASISKGQPQPLVVIAQMDPLIAEFFISEKEFPNYDVNLSTVVLQPLCTAASEIEGEIFFIDNGFESTSGKLLMRASVPNPGICLRPGQSIRVKIAKDFLPQQIVVPQKAIKYDAEGPYAYIIDDANIAMQKHVRLGPQIDEDVVIAEGIADSDNIVTVGHLRLSPGLTVEIKE